VNRLGWRWNLSPRSTTTAYVHSTDAFDGKPQRYRTVQPTSNGQIAELLSKTTKQGALDQAVTQQDREILLTARKEWGALDANHQYATGWKPGRTRVLPVIRGGLNSVAIAGKRIEMGDCSSPAYGRRSARAWLMICRARSSSPRAAWAKSARPSARR